MADGDEAKPEQEAVPSPEAEQDGEEGGWPGWLSWGLVIVAAVFGGFLLGSRGGGQADSSSSAQRLASARELALMRQEHKQALERADRVLENLMMRFCREMIYTGLFRDGLDEKLKDVEADLGKAVQRLAVAGATPEDRITKATGQLKDIDKKVGQMAKRYSLHSAALEKVGKIGTYEEALKVQNNHLAYLYLVRVMELMVKAKTGDARALKEARGCNLRIGQLQPDLAKNLAKQYPELAGQPATAPATQSVP